MIRSTLSDQMTLGDFYHAYVLPIHRRARQADPKTIALDEVALKHWERLTRNPPLAEITEYDMADFVMAAMELDGRHGEKISPNTVIKNCIHLQFVLDRAGPRSRTLRNAANLISQPPGFEKPKARRRATPMLLSLEDIGKWLAACNTADDSEWWRSLIIFLYNTGLRIDCTMKLEWSMVGDDGWLTIPATIYKGHEHGGAFFANRFAVQALAGMKRFGSGRLFPWAGWPESASWLQEQRRRIWREAGIDQPGNGFHGLRRALLTWLSGRNDLVARLVAGHAAGGDMLRGHYVDIKKVIPELLEQVPQPIV
jgi:integrase